MVPCKPLVRILLKAVAVSVISVRISSIFSVAALVLITIPYGSLLNTDLILSDICLENPGSIFLETPIVLLPVIRIQCFP